jgi:RimJ/RimL family protein N-acetyltransferase
MKLFETARLAVRELETEDLGALHAISGDPEVVQYLGDGKPMSLEATRQWIERARESYRRSGYGTFGVEEKAGGRFVGWCGFVQTNNAPDVEVVYAFAKDRWGQGYASELAPALMDYGFGTLRLKRIVASIAPQNQASIHVVRKSGMRYDETRLDQFGVPAAFYSADPGVPNISS